MAHSLLVLLLPLLFLVQVCQASQCHDYLDCGACTANPYCGWCSVKKECTGGRASGPTGGLCSLEHWTFSPNECESVCKGWASCGDCTPQHQCGWCNGPTNYGCFVGIAAGPQAGECSGTNWDFNYAQCGRTPAPTSAPGSSVCSTHHSCEGCTAAASGSCGWCATWGMYACAEGTSAGPSGVGMCPAGQWDWNPSSCSAKKK